MLGHPPRPPWTYGRWFFSTYTKISVFRQKRARSLAFMTDDATAHGTVLLQLEQDGLRRK